MAKTIQIKDEIYNSLEEKFKKDELQFAAINISNTEDFINYILNNFIVSSKEFDALGDKQKEILEKVNLNDVDVKSLFEQVIESFNSDDDSKEENKETSTLGNSNISNKN